MKLLQNPIVVTVLAGVAVGLVAKNVVWPMISKGGGSGSRPQTVSGPSKPVTVSARSKPRAAQPVRTQAVAAGPTNQVALLPSVPMDVPRAWQESLRWTASPRRDPFQFKRGPGDGATAQDLFKLTGTWRQTDSTLAVLNNQVVSVGETIQGYRVATIEVDRVWVEGPYGREPIVFKISVPKRPGATNEPAGQAEAPEPDEAATPTAEAAPEKPATPTQTASANQTTNTPVLEQ